VDAVAESLPELPEERRREVAVAWVYSTALVAWLEDHGLVAAWLRKAAVDRRAPIAGHPDAMRAWLRHAVASLAIHPATRCLIDPRWNPAASVIPPNEVCRNLADWWASDDAPSFAYDTTGHEPPSITGWWVGDLLQALSDTRRKAHALVQTPHFVADFIIDLTLLPAADEYRDEPVLSAIDPTCGSGHFLIRLVDYLYELYTTGTLAPRQARTASVTGWDPVDPATAIQRILAGVTGVDIDPLTTAVARLRMVVVIGDLMHRAGLLDRLRLDAIPATVKPRVAVGDSLLAGMTSWDRYAQLHPAHAAIYGLDGTRRPPAEPAQGHLFPLETR
jgi:hypothetical protein